MITGVERSFIVEISPKELKGTMLGLHSTIVRIALLPEGIILGVLWDGFGARVSFIFGANMSLEAAGVLLFLMKGIKTMKE